MESQDSTASRDSMSRYTEPGGRSAITAAASLNFLLFSLLVTLMQSVDIDIASSCTLVKTSDSCLSLKDEQKNYSLL